MKATKINNANENASKELLSRASGPRTEKVMPAIMRLFSNVSRTLDINIGILSDFFADPDQSKLIIGLLQDLKKSGIVVRIITKITSENTGLCKMMIPHCNIYHLDGVIGTFCILDGQRYYCDCTSTSKQDQQLPVAAYYHSDQIQFVKIQQFLFENLLKTSTHAKDKIREIEKGVENEYIETIRDPVYMLQLIKEKIKHASFEVLALFSTINSFYRADSDGIIEITNEIARRGTNTRILIKIEGESTKEEMKNDIRRKYDSINVNFFRQPMSSKIITFVIDQTFSLTVEINDDSRKHFADATGFSTYSNSESTVFTYNSMFENLWIQAELERQNVVKQAYFKMFKGLKLKDEIYDRDWKLKEEDENVGNSSNE